ncbi:thiamine-phosphate diphosphorylase [Corynebacterium mustelae]|uniref:Thiamine-phosphate synthase n=1 Tax=Corynebacterium mustelae TaxID=571915 RepID=A0A0G3GWB9_9CORY|nr:thiamine phosphate synthase [Corynebacterium mustelae]AKK05481.1 thiamine-phosphate diphosphorylase [Corynebacterium mustelae]
MSGADRGASFLHLYLVTDHDLCLKAGRSVLDTVSLAVEGGVTCVQLREKKGQTKDFLELTVQVCQAVGHKVPVIINDRVDVFLAARALGVHVAGVHVGHSDLPARLVRELIGPHALLGLSAATPAEVREAEESGVVDYIGVGTVHSTTTKDDAPRPLGVEGVSTLAASTHLPTVAIGGIGVADMEPLGKSHIDGVAVVSAICSALDARAASQELYQQWQRGRDKKKEK